MFLFIRQNVQFIECVELTFELVQPHRSYLFPSLSSLPNLRDSRLSNKVKTNHIWNFSVFSFLFSMIWLQKVLTKSIALQITYNSFNLEIKWSQWIISCDSQSTAANSFLWNIWDNFFSQYVKFWKNELCVKWFALHLN